MKSENFDVSPDMDLEQIKNWFRINMFRVSDASEEGSLHALYALKDFRALEKDSKNKLALESLLRHIDNLERFWERRQSQAISRAVARKVLRKHRPLRFALMAVIAVGALAIAIEVTKVLLGN